MNFDVIFIIIMIIAVELLVFIYLLLDRLKKNHAAFYQAMGQPKIYQRGAVFSVLKFIIKREYSALNDQQLKVFSYAIACNLIIYIILFAILCTGLN